MRSILILKDIILQPFPRGVGNWFWLLFVFSCVSPRTEDHPDAGETRAVILTQMSLVKGFLDKGQTSEAWANVRQLYRRHPENPDVLNLVGLTHLALDNKAKAIRLFAKAYKLKPKPSYGLNLSSAYITIGAVTKARKIIVKILRAKQKYRYRERLWHNLALTFEKQKKMAKARKYYLKAARINPNFLLSLIHLGKVNQAMGRDGEAIKVYRSAMKVCPKCFEPVDEVSRHLINRGNPEIAVKILRSYLGKNPENKNAIQDAKNLLDLAQGIRNRQGKNLRPR